MSKRDDSPNKPAPVATVDEAAGEPFLKRWSRLKSGDDAQAGDADIDAEAEEGVVAETPGDGEAPAIDPADLPDVESLDKDSDYTVFMQEGVPDAVRNLALRKLFASNPALAVLDGLNDYDDDYSKLGIVTQTVKTAYKAGRGFLEDGDLVEIDEAEEIDDVDETEVAGGVVDGDEDGDAPADLSDAEAGEDDQTAAASDKDDKTAG
jgi:hypothetical protein